MAWTRTFVLAGIGMALVGSLFVLQYPVTSAEPKADEFPKPASADDANKESGERKELATATFGSGCFWCTEALFDSLKGVKKAESGYSGGKVKNPTYRAVCTGETGHAEVVQVTYDPQVISYPELLEVFWKTHDPTTLNRQGADRGTQYRSVVFFHDQQQQKLAKRYMKKLDESGAFNQPVVTEISKFDAFYPAEDYHQDYFALNKRQPYCRAVIVPKLEKFQKVFADKLKAAPKEGDE